MGAVKRAEEFESQKIAKSEALKALRISVDEQAKLVLQEALNPWILTNLVRVRGDYPEDILDPDIASEKSRDDARKESSRISKKWRILSRIQVEDFIHALSEAYD